MATEEQQKINRFLFISIRFWLLLLLLYILLHYAAEEILEPSWGSLLHAFNNRFVLASIIIIPSLWVLLLLITLVQYFLNKLD